MRRLPLLLLLLIVQGAAAQSLDLRLDQVSRELLGRPYRFSPLGEGSGPDPDPLLRLDAFDCTTYVETVMALAMRDTHEAQLQLLNRIRYRDGDIGFAQRRHLPATQWLPGLQQLGVIVDITDSLGPARHLAVRLSPQVWQARRWRILEDLPADAVPEVEVELSYLPLAGIETALSGVREVALLSVVHETHEGAPLSISHQALLIPDQTGARVRHARSGSEQAVIEEPLQRFVQRLRSERFWPVLGLNVADLRQPANDMTR